MSTTSVTRWSQIAISALLGCYTALICFTNITDYNTNFLFIQNVAGMTDIFSTGNGWRSIQNPMLLHLTYWLIIAAEGASGWFCLRGSYNLWSQRHAENVQFEAKKGTVLIGLLIGLCLWLGAFLLVGGEWFLMWQSEKWNAQATAFHLTQIYLLAWIVIVRKSE